MQRHPAMEAACDGAAEAVRVMFSPALERELV